MFSYRHAFHAGNHGDVLKHAIFVHVLDYFQRKDSPYWVIDTHAGAGIYDLHGDWASQNAEFATGLSRLLPAQNKPELITRYLEEVQHFNPDNTLHYYPGSPWLALRSLRPGDRLRLFEMHPAEVDALQKNLIAHGYPTQRQIAIIEADGFSGLKALLPPPTKRGIVLIDPSYEDKTDYRSVVQTLNEGLKRFASGCYIVWYPLVPRLQVQQMARALERLRTPWVHATLSVSQPATSGHGMHGSGMFIINPPYTLHQSLKAALPWLVKTLGQDKRAGYTLTHFGK